MVYKKKIICKLLFASFLIARTPFEYAFLLSSGYDNNVMRLSSEEFKRANQNVDLLGGVEKFDSFIYKVGFKGKKSLWELGKKEFFIKGNIDWANYQHNQYKKYWSSGLDLTYKWGSFRNIRYSLRHLNNFYLRHYIDRDISTSKLSPCLFTDHNQKLLITFLIQKNFWANFGIGFLQRYYAEPFREFDLDIFYFRFKLSKKIKKIGSISFQLENGLANSDLNLSDFRPSSFDRSYKTLEWYIPIILKSKLKILNEFGFSIRNENREYVAESLNDPLHSGRNHFDTKYDFWVKKDINNTISAKFSTRIRRRNTFSEYDWVSDLKSFNQVQVLLKIEWKLIYDKY